MNNEIQIPASDYLDYLNGIGITRFDSGRIERKSGNWIPELIYVIDGDTRYHETINECFKEYVHNKMPISYYCERYRDKEYSKSLEDHTRYVYFKFEVQSNYCKDTSSLNESNDYRLREIYPDSMNCSKHDRERISDICKRKRGSISKISDNFKDYQQVFTNIVGEFYNSRFNDNIVRYVSIVLYPVRINEYIDFTHFAVIFSKNDPWESNRNSIDFVLQMIYCHKSQDLLRKYQDKIKLESIKSAKAAIMSRNMSHNLGSHVMFYIKQKLQSVSKIVDSDVLHNILPGDISDLEEVRKQISERKRIELPFLVGLGRFINYLQERQDYIATVATDYIPSNSTISFKDFIYDELKPDLRYKRHHPEGSNSDAGWQPGNLLLDYIAYSEGYVNSDAIQISFDEFNGLNSTDNSDFDKLRKFNIAVPGGVIGRQAIFSIMENIIRNAAKHSIRREDNKISITFSQIDTMEKLYSLNQNGCTLRTKRAENADIESGEALLEKYESAMCDYHILEIKLNMLNRSRDVDALLDKLGEDYVDSAGIMKECSKGLKEMRISAAWLRGYSVDSDINPTLPPVLSVRTIPCCDDKVMFSYLICLPKPKKVAFLLEDVKEYEYLNDLLTTYGCRLYKYERDLQIQDYDLVCLGLSDETHINEIVSNVSSRIIVDSNIAEEFIKNIKTSEPNEIKAIIDGVYDSWFENWCSKSYASLKPNLLILDEKSYKKNQQYASDFANEVILSTTGNMSDEVCHNSVVYSTHYPGISKLPEEVAKKYSNALSVESITGNNSTDRLIRQDDWNREWYNKHLHAGIVKVGIFDERIYSTFITTKSSINETSFFADCESLKNGNLKLLDFAKKYDISINDSRRLKGADHDYIRDFLASKKSVDASVAQMNRERRVWAIDLKEESDKLILKGFNSNTQDKIGMSAFDNIEDAEINIAVIEKANDGFEIKSLMGTYENPFYQTFDMISIHQGILDKIYTVLGIKDNRDEKYKVTHALHKFFMKSQTPKNEKEYLPYLVIHSGRSKPNRDDMPQKQPFVQFAAIDHAVKDCKYTLVELLTSAYYESDSNN